MKISIIVPVYNVEQYVQQCLESILNQKSSSLEVELIIVNDGSTDNSASIARRCVEGLQYVKIIDQHNQGLSMARNNGLQIATGDYVWFVDSDDWIAHDAINAVEKIVCSNELDSIIISSLTVQNNTSFIKKEYQQAAEKYYTGKDVLAQEIVPTGVPYSIYSRKFLMDNDLKMKAGIVNEDCEFTSRSYYLVQKTYVSNHIFYYRRGDNPNSITHVINAKKVFDYFIVIESLFKFSSEAVRKEDQFIFRNTITRHLNSMLLEARYLAPNHIKEFKRRLAMQKNIYRYIIQSPRLKYKIEGLLFYLFPKDVLLTHKLLNNIYPRK